MNPNTPVLTNNIRAAVRPYAANKSITPALEKEIEDKVDAALAPEIANNLLDSYSIYVAAARKRNGFPTHVEVSLRYVNDDYSNVVIQMVGSGSVFAYALFLDDAGTNRLSGAVINPAAAAQPTKSLQPGPGDPDDAWDRSMRGV